MDMAYFPEILQTLTQIAARMGVSEETVKRWAEMGAPISVEGAGTKTRYSAETAALQQWRMRKFSLKI